MKPQFLLVGLGNPGVEYEDTRHNVGFWVADLLGERARVETWDFHSDALVGEGSLKGRAVAIAKPATYMNKSGEAVRRLLNRYGLDRDGLLLIYDDLHLDEGVIRLRPKGSAAGHNGVQHVIDRLGTADFPRLRLGIGSAFARGQQVRYVLQPFTQEQRPLIDEAVVKAADAAEDFVKHGLGQAMTRHNG